MEALGSIPGRTATSNFQSCQKLILRISKMGNINPRRSRKRKRAALVRIAVNARIANQRKNELRHRLLASSS
jgi:hypothetical protein